MRIRHRIVNIRRFMTAVLALTFAVCLILAVTVFANEKRDYKTEEGRIYIVAQGDTLWDIAIEHKGKTEIRAYIHKLRKANSLQTSDLQIGQKLKLP